MSDINPVKSVSIPNLHQLYKGLFSGGKGLRAQIVEGVCQSLNFKSSLTLTLQQSIEGIHHASLLHDDVLDDSIIRRNHLTAWMKFSKNKAILAGDYLLAQVSYNIANCENHDVAKLTAETIKHMVHGEWIQDDQKGKESLSRLDQVHVLKTSTLFQWCLKVPFLFCYPADSKVLGLLDNVGKIFGQLFQRADDMMDFGFRNKENKNPFKDLKEGYLNFFGTYLTEKGGLSEKSLRKCQSLKDLEKLAGKDFIDQQIKNFDTMNEKLIEECFADIDRIEPLLDKTHHKAINVLKSWPRKLYFRDSV